MPRTATGHAQRSTAKSDGMTRSLRIVAFTKDWDDVPTCTTHILRHMARTLPVLWVESIGLRRPNLAAAHDWRRLARKLARALRGVAWKSDRLGVLTPLVIPGARSPAGQILNRSLLRHQIRRALGTMPAERTEYWCFVPNATPLLPRTSSLPPSPRELHPGKGHPPQGPSLRVIYYCVDDWSTFHNLDGAWLAACEAELLRRADLILTPARALEEKCRREARGPVYYSPHGVDYAAFSRALDPDTVIPPDLARLPSPRVGFYGNLHPWVDRELIAALARAEPSWTFVLIGDIFVDLSPLKSFSNVHLLGRREHDQLPAYCKGFDVAIIPYDLRQPRMASVHPVKIRELLAAGVPIVSCALPELRSFEGSRDIEIARDFDEWRRHLAAQMARTDRKQISQRMSTEDWARKVAWMRSLAETLWESP